MLSNTQAYRTPRLMSIIIGIYQHHSLFIYTNLNIEYKSHLNKNENRNNRFPLLTPNLCRIISHWNPSIHAQSQIRKRNIYLPIILASVYPKTIKKIYSLEQYFGTIPSNFIFNILYMRLFPNLKSACFKAIGVFY